MNQSEIVRNQELVSLLSKSIDQANKKDNQGLLETLQKISSFGTSIATIAQQVPGLIKFVSGLF